jgi:hypothetical protein
MPDKTAAWDGRPPNPEVEGWHWLQLEDNAPAARRWIILPNGGGIWTFIGPPGSLHETGYRYIGPASPDDARELVRLREGIEKILEFYSGPDGGWRYSLRRLLKGPTP